MKKLVTLVVLALLASAPKFAQASSGGVPSTGSFTVNGNSSLAQAKATGSLVVLSTSGLLGVRVNVGAFSFVAGRDYQVGASTNATATNLAAAIESSNAPVVASALAGDNTVSLVATDYGTLYNSVGLYTGNSLKVSTSALTLTGGLDNATASINAIGLTQGRDWFTQDVASNTAVSLASAINQNPVLRQYVTAVPLSAVVYIRAILSPAAYSLATTDNTNLTKSGSAMTGGSAGNIAPFICNLGTVTALPTANYPAGCTAYLVTDPTHLQLSTQTVVGSQSWLAK